MAKTSTAAHRRLVEARPRAKRPVADPNGSSPLITRPCAAAILGVGKRGLEAFERRADFPKPVAVLGAAEHMALFSRVAVLAFRERLLAGKRAA